MFSLKQPVGISTMQNTSCSSPCTLCKKISSQTQLTSVEYTQQSHIARAIFSDILLSLHLQIYTKNDFHTLILQDGLSWGRWAYIIPSGHGVAAGNYITGKTFTRLKKTQCSKCGEQMS